jgi:uncharacterized protein YfaT (DUF1175 family)
MSRTKRFLFENHAVDEPAKATLRAEFSERLSKLPVRIATRRKNKRPGRRWDPLWPSSLAKAARELAIEALRVNDGMFVATGEDAARLIERAEGIQSATEAKIYPPQ